jgi:PQQ enzyme repeat
MSRSFPGGICDDAGKVGYLSLGGELLAVDLTTGAVKWRRADEGELLAASDEYLLTRRDTPTEPILELRQAESGRTLTSLTAAQLPGFASVSPGDALDALLRDTAEGVEILWRSDRRYLGGAVPPLHADAGGSSAGAVLLEKGTGAARAIAAAPPPPPAPAPESTPAGPDTIAAARVGNSHFALKNDGGQIRLEARNPRGELRWSTTVGIAKPTRPGPLRQ